MIGLIKKDLLMMKQNVKFMLIVFVVFAGLTIVNESNMIFMFPVMAVIVSISTFSYDAYNKWDAYAAALPDGRRNVVRAKYISTCITVIISFLISMITLYIIAQCGLPCDLSSATKELTGGLLACLLIVVIAFPMLYQFGVEKGRIALFVVSFGVAGISALIVKFGNIRISGGVVDFFEQYYMVVLPIIACLLLLISYQISKRVYSNKEF